MDDDGTTHQGQQLQALFRQQQKPEKGNIVHL
jgi:hypothetical protein